MTSQPSRIKQIDFKRLPSPLAFTLQGFRDGTRPFSNFAKTLAHAPSILEAYLAFSDALTASRLPATTRHKIALAVSELNSSEYDVAAHSQEARSLGLTEDEIELCRRATPSSPRDRALLQFAQTLIKKQGNLSDAELEEARQYSDDDQVLVETVATIAAVHFANLVNNLAQTPLDAPAPRTLIHPQQN